MIRHLNKLSYKFILIVLCSALLSFSLFTLLFMNRYRVFHFLVDQNTLLQDTRSSVQELQQEITDQKLSRNDKWKIKRGMKKYKTLSMQLYDENNMYIDEHLSELENSVYIETTSFLLELYYPEAEDYTLNFSDGSYKLVVYSFQGVNFMVMYVFAIIVFCTFLFLSLITHFIRVKMKYLISLEQEMKLIEAGDFQHPIIYKGNDELTSLARQLNHLRSVLANNTRKEAEARRANEELITTMSHDLRTPLTSLLGYLDIMELKLYKSEEEKDIYIQKCKQKADQIKYMSDRLFTHFFIYAQDDNISLKDISCHEIEMKLDHLCEELIERGFQIQLLCEYKQYYIKGDINLIDRLFNNLFSNVVKYADGEKNVIVKQIEINKMVIVSVSNQKKERSFMEESTCIGLKSMHKMVTQMSGTMNIIEDNDCYCIELRFPCRIIN